MESGKHVYCEKPMTRYLDEAFEVHDTVKKTGKVFQVGSQGCSGNGWHKAAEMIKGGKIGTLVWAQGYYCRNNPKGEWNYTRLKPRREHYRLGHGSGPSKTSAFSAEHYLRWRKYYPYCAGLARRSRPAPAASAHARHRQSGIPDARRQHRHPSIHTDKDTPARPNATCPNTSK